MHACTPYAACTCPDLTCFTLPVPRRPFHCSPAMPPQLTWSHCAAHLQFALPGKVVGPDDLRLAARLAPDALLLRPIKRKSDTGAAADPGSKPGATHVGAGNPVGTEGGVAAGAGAGVVGGAGGPAGGGVQEGRHGGHGGGGWDVGGVDRAQQLDSLVAGAVGAGPGAVGPAAPAATSAADGDEEDFAIELLDPGRWGGGAVCAVWCSVGAQIGCMRHEASCVHSIAVMHALTRWGEGHLHASRRTVSGLKC